MTNDDGKSKRTATKNCQGIDTDPLTLSANRKKSDKLPHKCNVPVESLVCFCLLSWHLLRAFPVSKRWGLGVKRHLWSLGVLQQLSPASEHAVVAIPCYISATQRQRISNPISHKHARREAALTQEWGSMPRQRRAVVWSGWRGGGQGEGRFAEKLDRNSNGSVMEGDKKKKARVIKWGRGFLGRLPIELLQRAE